MDRIKFQVDGYLEGGFPIEEDDIETITELDCYEELIGFIEEGNDKEDNIYQFNEELFEEWLDENGGDGLQDGCSYFFGGACYDLDGVGCNACSIDHESIEKAFN